MESATSSFHLEIVDALQLVSNFSVIFLEFKAKFYQAYFPIRFSSENFKLQQVKSLKA
jgi:hypothetical protein